MGVVSNIQIDDHQKQGHYAIMKVAVMSEFAQEEHGKRESTADNVGLRASIDKDA